MATPTHKWLSNRPTPGMLKAALTEFNSVYLKKYLFSIGIMFTALSWFIVLTTPKGSSLVPLFVGTIAIVALLLDNITDE